MRHDAVLECACVPAPDSTGRRGIVVKAFVVISEDRAATDDLRIELQNFVKANAVPYMYPRIVSFEAALPNTLNGKILRSVLRLRG